MKMTIASVLLVFLSSQAFAGSRTFLAGENFDMSSSTADADCLGIVSVLSQISTSDVSISIDDNCLLNKHHNKAVRILARVLSDIGSWGVNEVACKIDNHGAGCGDSSDYLSLQATIVVPKSKASSYQGNPVPMIASDCQFYASALSQLWLSSKKAKLDATCTDGTLQTNFIISK
jgi:hypothetical protein